MSGSGQAASRASCTSVSVESPTTGVASTPWAARISSHACSTSASVRPLITTCTPSRAMLSAQARPSPRLEAIRMARRPLMPRSIAAPQSSPRASRAAPISAMSAGVKNSGGSFGPQTDTGAGPSEPPQSRRQ